MMNALAPLFYEFGYGAVGPGCTQQFNFGVTGIEKYSNYPFRCHFFCFVGFHAQQKGVHCD